MKLRGCLKDKTAWSDSELRVLRERYQRDGGPGVATALGRSLRSVYIKAHRVGLVHERRWTADDDRLLKVLWFEASVRSCSERLKRSAGAVVERARSLGLQVGAIEGWEYLTAAQERTGFEIVTIYRIVEWAQAREIVPSRWPVIRLALHAPPPKGKKRRWRRHIVEIDSLDDAIAAWLDAETLQDAARRHGVAGDTLRRALVGYDDTRPGDRKHWRIPSKTTDAAMAARAGRESLNEAARRLGLSKPTVLRRLRAAGVTKTAHNWNIPRETFDAAVARAA